MQILNRLRAQSLSTDVFFAATLGIIATIYALTISSFVQGGDSGELVVTALKLATPHPPGYPLYTFFAHFFTSIPLSTVAWRVGLFSLVCQLLCSGILFCLSKAWLRENWVAAMVTLMFSLAPLTWRYAIEPEVFALSNLFAVLLLATFFKFQQTRSLRWAYSGCAVLGLACSHHMTILFLASPCFLYFLWSERKTLLHVRVLLTGSLIFALGLLPYLFMFYLGRQRLLIAWGDFSTWDGFWTHVLRREYGTFQLATGGKENAGFLSKIYYFTREMWFETFGLGLLLLLWSLRSILSKARDAGFARLLLGSLLFYVGLFHLLSNLDLSISLYHHAQARMWILPLLMICMLAGWGVKELTHKFRSPFVLRGAQGLLALGLIASVVYNWNVQDESRRDFFERMGHTMLDAVETNAVVLMREDTYVNSMRYLQVVDGVRPDVHLLPLDTFGWPWMKGLVEQNVEKFKVPGRTLNEDARQIGTFTLRQLLDANIDQFPIYISKILPAEEKTLRGAFMGFPYGFHSRVKREGALYSIDEIKRESAPYLGLRMPDKNSYAWDSWESYIYKNYYDVKIVMPQVLVGHANARVDWLLAAMEILKAIAVESEDYRKPALGFLGDLYNMFAPTYVQYHEMAIKTWEEYLAYRPDESEDTVKIRKALMRLKGTSP